LCALHFRKIHAFALDPLADFGRQAPVDAISITTHGASAALLNAGDLALPVLDHGFDGPDAPRRGSWCRFDPLIGNSAVS
jgi:hypothetical protein